MTKQLPTQLGPQRRAMNAQLRTAAEDKAALLDTMSRTASLSFASETPVDMWFGTEILSMAPGAMRTGVRQLSMPLLFNHNPDDLLGVVVGIRIDADRVARADVRFGLDARGEWAMQQNADGVLVNVSFMYRVFKWLENTETDTVTAIDWEPYEISLVTVPADPTVGSGRSAETAAENGVQVIRSDAATTPATAGNGAPGVPLAPGAHSNLETPQEPEDMNVRFRTRRLQEQADPQSSTGGGAIDTTTTTVDHARHMQRGAEAERARMTEIEALCRKYNVTDEVRAGMIQKGATIDQARMTVSDIVLERAAKSSAPAANFGDTHNPDLSEREKARYSMIRAINAIADGGGKSDWSKAGFELECSNEIAKKLGRSAGAGGFFMPTNLSFASRASYAVGTVGTGTSGGTLVGNQLLPGSFIEVLRNKARVMQLGATVLSGLVGNITIPRQTGQSSTFWTGENVNTSESEATFDAITLAMKTIGTYSMISRNMLMQSTPDIDMLVRADLMASIALGVDLAALSGSGSGAQPLGIANQSGIGSVIMGTNGGPISIDTYIDLETQLTTANAPEESLAYLGNARTVGSSKKLKSTTGQYLWTNAPAGGRSSTPGEINGYTFARSNQARSTLSKGTSSGTLSELFFGAWSELLIGEWGVVEIMPNPYDPSVYKSGGTLLRVLQSLDIGVRHAASFAVASDVQTP